MNRVDICKPIYVPEDIATCPGCKQAIIVDPMETYVDDDGMMRIGDFHLECCAEPDFEDAPTRAKWEEQHALVDQMPYEYWLPIDQKVEAWLKTVEIVDSDADKKKLATWNKWARGE